MMFDRLLFGYSMAAIFSSLMIIYVYFRFKS